MAVVVWAGWKSDFYLVQSKIKLEFVIETFSKFLWILILSMDIHSSEKECWYFRARAVRASINMTTFYF